MRSQKLFRMHIFCLWLRLRPIPHLASLRRFSMSPYHLERGTFASTSPLGATTVIPSLLAPIQSFTKFGASVYGRTLSHSYSRFWYSSC